MKFFVVFPTYIVFFQHFIIIPIHSYTFSLHPTWKLPHFLPSSNFISLLHTSFFVLLKFSHSSCSKFQSEFYAGFQQKTFILWFHINQKLENSQQVVQYWHRIQYVRMSAQVEPHYTICPYDKRTVMEMKKRKPRFARKKIKEKKSLCDIWYESLPLFAINKSCFCQAIFWVNLSKRSMFNIYSIWV